MKYMISGNFICDGIVYVAGVMIGYWAEYFDANLAAVAFIGSIMNGIAFGNGPIVACLIKKFGSRSGKTIFDSPDVNNVYCHFLFDIELEPSCIRVRQYLHYWRLPRFGPDKNNNRLFAKS